MHIMYYIKYVYTTHKRLGIFDFQVKLLKNVNKKGLLYTDIMSWKFGI